MEQLKRTNYSNKVDKAVSTNNDIYTQVILLVFTFK